jgi:hypothetical protein
MDATVRLLPATGATTVVSPISSQGDRRAAVFPEPDTTLACSGQTSSWIPRAGSYMKS